MESVCMYVCTMIVETLVSFSAAVLKIELADIFFLGPRDIVIVLTCISLKHTHTHTHTHTREASKN